MAMLTERADPGDEGEQAHDVGHAGEGAAVEQGEDEGRERGHDRGGGDGQAGDDDAGATQFGSASGSATRGDEPRVGGGEGGGGEGQEGLADRRGGHVPAGAASVEVVTGEEQVHRREQEEPADRQGAPADVGRRDPGACAGRPRRGGSGAGAGRRSRRPGRGLAREGGDDRTRGCPAGQGGEGDGEADHGADHERRGDRADATPLVQAEQSAAHDREGDRDADERTEQQRVRGRSRDGTARWARAPARRRRRWRSGRRGRGSGRSGVARHGWMARPPRSCSPPPAGRSAAR